MEDNFCIDGLDCKLYVPIHLGSSCDEDPLVHPFLIVNQHKILPFTNPKGAFLYLHSSEEQKWKGEFYGPIADKSGKFGLQSHGGLSQNVHTSVVSLDNWIKRRFKE